MLFVCRSRCCCVRFWMGCLIFLLGMAARPASGQAAQDSPPAEPVGVVIEEVKPGSAAAKAHLLGGDVLLRYAGRPLNSPAGFFAAIVNLSAQPKVTATVRRGTQTFEVSLEPETSDNLKWVFRPQLPPKILSLYREGRKQYDAKHWEAASTWWQSAFREAEAAGDKQMSGWLCGQIAGNYSFLADDAGRTPTQALREAHLNQALQWGQRMLDRAAQGQDQEAQALVSMAMGAFNLNLQKLAEAVTWAERAYPLAAACHDEVWMADCLDVEGTIALNLTTPEFGGSKAFLNAKARIEKARKLINDAFEIRKRLAPNSLSIAQSYENLTQIAVLDGNLKTAYERAASACALYLKLAPDSPALAKGLHINGIICLALGDTTKARKDFESALDIYRRKAPAARQDIANVLSQLAVTAAAQGDTQKASAYVQQTLRAWQNLKPPSALEKAGLRNSQGLIAVMQGDLESAESYYEEALLLMNKAAPISQERISALTALGLAELARDEFPKSQKRFEDAYAVLRLMPPSSTNRAMVINCLGLVSESLGNPERAAKYYQEAREAWRQAGPRSQGMVTSLIGLANLALSRGELTPAETLCEEALAIGKSSTGPLGEAKLQTLLGQIYLRRRQTQKALPCFQRAVFLLEGQRQAISSLEDRAFLVQQNADAFTGLMQTYLALGKPPKAFDVLERIHARALADSIARRRYDLIRQLPPKFRDRQIALDDQRRMREKELQQAQENKQAGQEQSARKSLEALTMRQRRLDADLALVLPRLSAIEYPQPIAVEAAKRALPPGTLALSYAADEKQTYLFTLTRKSFHFYRLPLSRAQLIAKVNGARAVYADIHSTRSRFTPVLQDLYQQLLAPAQQEIDRAQSLLVCPDGPLHYVPFSALMRKDGRFLIEKMPVSVVGSLTIYRHLGSGRQFATPKALALGDPAYQPMSAAKPGDSPGDKSASHPTIMAGTRQELPETGSVAVSVGKIYAPRSLVLTKRQATPANLIAKCADVDVLHLGCHGMADERDPLNSCLALAPSSHDANGLLHVWQIMRMKTSVHLVVLWACETGAGTDSRFEGIQGVARAFLTAGANNVLMSLWVVQDKPSAELLLDFYRTWKNGQGRKTIAAALREAQIRALKRDPRPYLWATFVLNGAGR